MVVCDNRSSSDLGKSAFHEWYFASIGAPVANPVVNPVPKVLTAGIVAAVGIGAAVRVGER